MHLVDLHVLTNRRSLWLNPDLRSLAATQAKRTAASDLHHCATGAGHQYNDNNSKKNNNNSKQYLTISYDHSHTNT